jgi:Na+/H+ antiporter NhaA
MNLFLKILIGLVVGYTLGVVIAAFTAFVLDLDDIARFIAIGSGIAGAILGPVLLAGRDLGAR